MKPEAQVERQGVTAILNSRNPPADDRLFVKWLEMQLEVTQYAPCTFSKPLLTIAVDLHIRD